MSNRKNYFWAVTLGLILMLFVSVAVSRVVDLHFRSWTNWPEVEVDGPWGRFARSAVEIMEVAVIPVTLVVGTYLGWQAVHHRPKPYLAGLAAAVFMLRPAKADSPHTAVQPQSS